MHDEGFGLPHLSLCCQALLSSLTSPRAYRIQSTMKSIAGSTNAAIVALVVARSSRAVTAFQPGSGRLFSSRAGATTGRGMHGLAMSTAAAAVMGVASSRCAHEMLDEGMFYEDGGSWGGQRCMGSGQSSVARQSNTATAVSSAVYTDMMTMTRHLRWGSHLVAACSWHAADSSTAVEYTRYAS